MKYTGKWWDNPKRSEKEREVMSIVLGAFYFFIITLTLIVLLVV